jgi:hypothetical protein
MSILSELRCEGVRVALAESGGLAITGASAGQIERAKLAKTELIAELKREALIAKKPLNVSAFGDVLPSNNEQCLKRLMIETIYSFARPFRVDASKTLSATTLCRLLHDWDDAVIEGREAAWLADAVKVKIVSLCRTLGIWIWAPALEGETLYEKARDILADAPAKEEHKEEVKERALRAFA